MKKLALILFVLLLSLTLSAQGVAEQQQVHDNALFRATDANGRTLQLSEVPTSVIVAGKAAVMPANALFLFPEVAAMEVQLAKTDQGLGDFFSLLRPSLDEVPRFPQRASVEEIVAQNAGLILLKSVHYESIGKKLDQMGVANYTMNLESYDEWKSEITQLGKLLNNQERAKRILSLYENRLSAITQKVGSIPPDQKKRVLLLQGVSDDLVTSFKIAPDSWMQSWMVAQVGANAVWKGANVASSGWSTVSFEQIAAWDPHVIYLVSYKTPTDSYMQEIYSSPLWAGLKAVQTHQVKATPADVMSYMQPVSSWILGAQWMAKDLYPHLFTSMDMEDEVRSFYQEMYTISDETKLAYLLDRFHASIALNSTL